MRKPFQMGAGGWWRFNAYEIRSGTIRPRRGATLEEYDPWELRTEGRQERQKRQKRRKRGRREAPYQTLISLVRKAARCENGVWCFNRSRSWERELLEWCSHYGLLGLLPQATQSVRLAPRWGKSLAFVANEPDSETVQVLTPQALQYNRINGGWFQQMHGRLLGFHPVQRPYSKKLEGQLVPKQLWLSDWPIPSVSLEQLIGIPGPWHEESLTETWSRFFPGVPKHKREIYAYPMPCTIEFWKAYAEPVNIFWAKGMELAKIHEDLFEVKRKWDEEIGDKQKFYSVFSRITALFARTSKDIDADMVDFNFIASQTNQESKALTAKLYWAIYEINNLVASARPALYFQNDGFHHRWQAASLVGALSMMLLQDLTAELIVRQCPVDGNLFSVRSEHWTKYCSAKCSETAKKRAQRARKTAESSDG